jgi:hypothetical protein
MTDLLTTEETAEIFRCSTRNLLRLRNEKMVEGIHWYSRGKENFYIGPLVRDLAVNWTNTIAHQRAIENYRASLLSGQKKKR